MHERLQGPWAQAVARKEEFLARLASVDPERRARRPGPGRWSMLEVAEHVVIVDGNVGTALAKAPNPDRPRVVRPGRWLRFSLLKLFFAARFRIRAPVPEILPTGTVAWEPLVERWARQRVEFERWLDQAPAEILDTPRFRHPIVGWLTVPQAVDFAGHHLRHHLNQVGRIARALEG